MKYQLRTARNAERQIRKASRWWGKNRPAAPALFKEELKKAFELIITQPTSGAVAQGLGPPHIRRVLLFRTRYYLYYSVSEAESAVEVLGLWHTSRGSDPDI